VILRKKSTANRRRIDRLLEEENFHLPAQNQERAENDNTCKSRQANRTTPA
jgi:hypothetical protein